MAVREYCLRCDKCLGTRLDVHDRNGRALFDISDPRNCRCLYPIASNKRKNHAKAKRIEYDRIIVASIHV